MRRWGGVVALVCIVIPLASQATDLELGAAVGSRWDSNLFSDPVGADPQDDFSFQISPQMRLTDDDGPLRYRLAYRPIYEAFVEFDDNNTWNQFVEANASWRITPRTNIRVTERLIYARANFLQEELLDQIGLERRLVNSATLGLSHALTPRTSGSLSFGHTLFEFDNENRSDGQTLTANLGLSRVLTPRSTGGIGAGATYQFFDGTDVTDSSITQTYRANLSWSFQYDPTITFSLNGGPALIISDPDDPGRVQPRPVYPTRTIGGTTGFVPIGSCRVVSGGVQVLEACNPGADALISGPLLATFDPPNATFQEVSSQTQNVSFAAGDSPGDLESQRFTFFGSVNLRKEWRRVDAQIGYTRSQRDISTQGGSEILDTVSARLNWRLRDRWRVSFTGGWYRRTSATDVTQTLTVVEACDIASQPPSGCGGFGTDGQARLAAVTSRLVSVESDSGVDTTSWRAGAIVRREVNEYVDLRLSVDFVNQVNEGDLAEDTTIRRWRVQMGVTAWLEPLHLF